MEKDCIGKIVLALLPAFAGAEVYGATLTENPEWITGSYVVPGEDDYAARFEDAPAPVSPVQYSPTQKSSCPTERRISSSHRR